MKNLDKIFMALFIIGRNNAVAKEQDVLNCSDDETKESADTSEKYTDTSEEDQIRKMIADAQSLLKRSMSEMETDDNDNDNEESNK